MIILQLILLIFLVYIIILLSYSMLRGAPFATIGKGKIKTMFDLLEIKKGKKFVDLGSGDGRIVLEASKKGLHSFGYEINPLLVLISILKLKSSDSNGKIFMRDYWRENFSTLDYISIWGVPPMMGRLEKKLLKELKPGAKVVSNHLEFPNWKYVRQKDDVYLYIKA